MRNNSMRNDQAEMVTRLVREQEAIEARRETEARATAHGLIQELAGCALVSACLVRRVKQEIAVNREAH